MTAFLPDAVALRPLALELARAPDRGGPLAGALLRRLLIVTAELHLAIDALALQLLLERPQRLVDIVIANDDLHRGSSLSSVCSNSQKRIRREADPAAQERAPSRGRPSAQGSAPGRAPAPVAHRLD